MDTMSNLIFIAILFTHSALVSASGSETLVNIKDSLPVLDPETKIIGGNKTTIEEHPYQVSIVINRSHFCGGFIVSENYILTAAHCVENCGPSDLLLRAGSSSWSSGIIIPTAEVIIHPEYNILPFDKDVAVLKTVRPIEFTEEIQAIPLPPKDRPVVEGTFITISGWGNTKEGVPSMPDELMQVKIPVVAYAYCRRAYPTELTDNMFCGGNYFLGEKDTCQGDSGGAAVQDGMAVGIVSFGRGCARPLYPSVFANIAAPAIRDFIEKETGL